MKENIEIQKPIIVDDVFHIVKNDNKYVIVVGQYVISPKQFDDTKSAIKYIKSKPWELILNVATLICTKIEPIRIKLGEKDNEKENKKDA